MTVSSLLYMYDNQPFDQFHPTNKSSKLCTSLNLLFITMTMKKISTLKKDTINTQNEQASSLSASAFLTQTGHSEFESRTLDFIARLDGAYSEHTIRAYRYNLWQISLFCQKHAYLIDALTPEQFNHYLLEDCKNDKASTIDRRISSFREYLHFIQAPDVTKHPDVKFCLRKIYRRIGCLRKQARPLQRHEVDLMLVTCDLDNPCGLRNVFMLELGYHSMRRGEEICSLRFEDIQMRPNGKMAILLRRSKTDQYGHGKWIGFPGSIAPLIERWKTHLNVTKGPILRGLYKDGSARTNPLRRASMRQILYGLQNAAGIEGENFSSHSFRVGGALDYLEAGMNIEKIMLKGGWHSGSTVIQYLRAWEDI